MPQQVYRDDLLVRPLRKRANIGCGIVKSCVRLLSEECHFRLHAADPQGQGVEFHQL